MIRFLEISLGIVLLLLLQSMIVSRAATEVEFEPDERLLDPVSVTGRERHETTIAVNPADPRNLVAGFHDFPTGTRRCRSVHSEDEGESWILGDLTPLEPDGTICFDPTIAADGDGNFYYAYGQVRGSFQSFDLLVAKSIDGGRTFPTFSVAGRGPTEVDPDKPVIAADAWTQSEFYGTLYLGFMDLWGATGTQIRVVVSRDGGSTWSAPENVSPFIPADQSRRQVHGPLPMVAPDGTAFIFYAEYTRETGPLSIQYARSRDGGTTWDKPRTVASNLPSPGVFRLKNTDPQYGANREAGIAAQSWPTAAAGPDGTLYVAWVDFPQGSCTRLLLGSACANADVRLAVSRNGGRSWSKPSTVSEDSGVTDQFHPWLSVGPDGLVHIIWLDKRLDAQNVNYDLFYTNTRDGRAFLPNLRVSSESSIVGHEVFIGDYNGVAANNTHVFTLWGDLRDRGHVDIFSARGQLLDR